MFNKIKSNSINQVNVIAILFAGVFAFISAFVIIFNEYREFEKEIHTLEVNYMQTQKRVVLQQSSRLYRMIKYRYEELKDKPKSTINNLIAKEIEIVLDDMDNGSYLFVFDERKKSIYESDFANLSDRTREDILKASKKGGGFYNFKSYKEDKLVDNISFFRKNKDLGWIIGSGVDLTEIERVLAKTRDEYRNKITGFILKIITLTLFLYLASILKYRYITDRISREVKFIVQSFKKASSDYHFIDRSQINLQEFRQITSHANIMIEKIKEKNRALADLNSNLENIIEEKTKELQKSVAYNKQLLADQDKFLKNAIHELNTPLSIILMNIDLYNLKFEKNSYLLKIEAAVKVLENIYEDLGFIVKKDRVEYKKEMIDLSSFVKERVNYFQDVALGNNLKLSAQIQEGIFVLFNEFELQRLCDNNISNAIKYSYINEEIFVRVFQKENCIVFEVQNIGDEIDFADKLFDRYYREDEARGGFGLGLNIVKEICDKYEIKVEVHSEKNCTIFRYLFECNIKVVK